MTSFQVGLGMQNLSQTSSSVLEVGSYLRRSSQKRQTGALVLSLLWMLGDLLAVWGAAVFSLSLRFRFGLLSDDADYSARIETHIFFLFLYFSLIVIFCNAKKLYSLHAPTTSAQESAAVAQSMALSSLLLTGCIYISGVHVVSRLVIASTMLCSLLGMLGWRTWRRMLLRKAKADGVTCRNVLLVGTNAVAQSTISYLGENRDLGFIVAGCVAGSDANGNEDGVSNAAVLGTVDDLSAVCRRHFIDEVIVCSQDRQTLNQVLAEARMSGTTVRAIPDFHEELASDGGVQRLGEFPCFLLYAKRSRAGSLLVKRLIDVLISSVALTILAPVMVALAILVKADSAGPVFYVSSRVGKRGHAFNCLKFRTMVSDAERQKEKLQHLNERDGVLFKISNDPRITRVGRYLRKYSLDELAQLINVLKGEMSLVGPRPPLAKEVAQYPPDFLRRLDVAPGITGLWQVEARRCPSFDKYVELDLKYVERWSLAMDMKLVWKTFSVVFAGTGQ